MIGQLPTAFSLSSPVLPLQMKNRYYSDTRSVSRLVIPLQRLFKFWGSRFSFVATILTPPNVDVCTCRSLSTRIVFELHRYRFINPFTCLSPQHALFTLLDPITVTLRRNADLHLFYGQKVKDSSGASITVCRSQFIQSRMIRLKQKASRRVFLTL